MNRVFLRKFALLAAFFWLPMSVFAQFCATHSLAMKIGGHDHPALVTAYDKVNDAQHGAVMTVLDAAVMVIDASTFWASVDDYDDSCDQTGICALAAIAAPISTITSVNFETASPRVVNAMHIFTTRATAPDTPPPRPTL
jgi:hypothetical protein